MHWYFRDISDDPSEKELTQQDQFNNDEVALAEAIVREAVQNSTDAQAEQNASVRVRFAISEIADGDERAFFGEIAAHLEPHLRACTLPVPNGSDALKVLVVEDFGTTGLVGAVDTKDNDQFSGFWRRFGRSNKEGNKGGRWGLGKLVFSSASGLRTVIGLTKRACDSDKSWIMGQAILRNHAVGGQEKDSVGFWCDDKAPRPGLPTSDQMLALKLARAARLRRSSETGLSLVIPALLPDITAAHLLAATIRNYYYPILTGRLVVEVDDVEVSAHTFESVTQSLTREPVPQSLLSFVRQLHAASAAEPTIVMPPAWQTDRISAETLGAETTEMLRDHYRAGKLLAIRAPIRIKPKEGRETVTHVDLFLKGATPGERTQTLVVRGSITVPTEGKKISLPDSHSALIATEDPISKLLGDAENPAHTQWNERAEKLRAGWEGGWSALRRVRAAVPELYALVAERIERDDPLAFLEFFSIPKSERAGETRPTTGRPKDLPPLDAEAVPDRETQGRLCHSFEWQHEAGSIPDATTGSVRLRYSFWEPIQALQRVRFQLLPTWLAGREGERGLVADAGK